MRIWHINYCYFNLIKTGAYMYIFVEVSFYIHLLQKGDITYEIAAVQTFSKMFFTKYDRFLTFLCTHKSSNFTMYGEVDAVRLEEE